MVGTYHRSGHLSERAADDLIKKGQAIFRRCLGSALTISSGGEFFITIQVDLQGFDYHLFKPFSLNV